jgi:Flp pilus assembly protein TadB
VLTVFAFFFNLIVVLLTVTSVEGYFYNLRGVEFLARVFRRREEGEVPRLLDSLAQGMRAGLNTEAAVRRAAQETIWTGECKLLLLKIQIGLDAGKTVSDAVLEALRTMSMGSDFARLRQSFVALATMQRTGGNIVRLLSDASDSARNAIYLRRKAGSLSAQMKLQATVISAAPSAVAGVLFVVSPSSLSVFWSDGIGFSMLCALVALNVFGVIVLCKIARSWSR